MKIGIVSCYYNRNYGSMLQAFATQKAIEYLGHEAITIQCLPPINYMTQSKFKYYLHKLTNKDIIKTKIRQYKGKRLIDQNEEYGSNIEKRNGKFDAFYENFINLSGLKKSRKELTEFAEELDGVVVGSDMLWHPVNIEHDYFTLTFVPDRVKKISYATSFGTTQIPLYQKNAAKMFLSRFNAISVREQSGIQVIEELEVGKSARVVLDPTLLFSGDEWIDIQPKERIVEGKYIFCYFLGVNPDHRSLANELKARTGYKIVSLPHLDEYVANDEKFGDYRLFEIGPGEFVSLIKNAEYILTDSFHGTCFSILNHKKFVTFNRFSDANSQSTNTRIDSLLDSLHLENRRIKSSICDISKIIGEEIDYVKTDETLKKLREESFDFLKQSIGEEND